MTLRGKFKIALILLAAITLARESGFYDVNYFRAKTRHHFSTSWKGGSTTVTVDKSTFHTDFTSQKYADLPVVVLYKGDTLSSAAGEGPAFVLTIEDITTEPLWTPLFTRASYSATASSFLNSELIKVNGAKLSSIHSNIKGRHIAEGETTIFGFSSYRNSLELIKQVIATDAIKAAKEYLSSLDENTAYSSGLPA
jgi:hypothetical protein